MYQTQGPGAKFSVNVIVQQHNIKKEEELLENLHQKSPRLQPQTGLTLSAATTVGPEVYEQGSTETHSPAEVVCINAGGTVFQNVPEAEASSRGHRCVYTS